MKQIFKVLSMVILLAALGGAIFLVRKSQETRRGAAVAETSSRVLPSIINSGVGQSFIATVMVDTGSTADKLAGAELAVSYDSAKLKYISLEPQGGYQMVNNLTDVDNGAGNLTLKMVTLGDEAAGAVSLVKITFEVKTEGNSNLTASGKIMVTGQSTVWSIATNLPSEVKVAGSGLAASPTPTCVPRPACLDAVPACLMPELSTYCPKSTPTPTLTPAPTVAATVTAPSNLAVNGQNFSWTPGQGGLLQYLRIGTDRTEVSTGCPGGTGADKGCFFASDDLPADLGTYTLIPKLAASTKYFFRVANRNATTGTVMDAIIEFTTGSEAVGNIDVGGTGMFQFKTTFAGVTAGAQCANDWKGQIMLRWGDNQSKIFSNVPFVKTDETTDGLMVFKAEVPMTEVGAKDGLAVFVKGPRSIQTKFGKDHQDFFYNQPGGELSWAEGAVFDFSKYPNLAGDVSGLDNKPDGKVDAIDFSSIKSEVVKRSEGDGMIADLNGNCKLESQDLSLLMMAMKDKQEQLY